MKSFRDTLSKRLSAIFILIAVLLNILSGCGAKDSSPHLHSDSFTEHFSTTVGQDLGLMTDVSETDSLFSYTSAGEAAVCLDIQAEGAIDAGFAEVWYPLALTSVVIAVDRSKTDETISSWTDLLSSDSEIGFSHDMQLARTAFSATVIASVSYALDGKEASEDAALSYFEKLHKDGRLYHKDSERAIVICHDTEAVRWIAEGRDMEIVVPAEGTLSFELGILSGKELSLPDSIRSTLTDSGYRLTNGESKPPYPSAQMYSLAEKDFDKGWLLDITRDVSSQFQRDVMDIRHDTTTDHREHVFAAVVLLVLIIFWMASVMQRIMRREVRILGTFMGILTAGWCVVRLIKWQLPTLTALNRYLWYGYYIFELPIPVVLLWLGLIINKPEEKTFVVPKLIKVLSGIYAALIAVIFTNDLHGLVWILDMSKDWNNDYGYGFMFYVITVFYYGVLFAALILMFVKTARDPRKTRRIFTILLSMVMMAFTISYVLGIPWAKNGDMAIITCSISVLFFEAAMRTGLLPANSKYRTLFTKTPLAAQIVDSSGAAVLRSEDARSISSDEWKFLEADPDHKLKTDESVFLRSHPICGGAVVWEEDIADLISLRKELESSVKQIEAANNLLSREHKVLRLTVENQIKIELFEKMEAEVKEKTLRLSRLIRDLENLEEGEIRRQKTAVITLLLCHIKRRCNLFFIAYEDEEMMCEELSMYLDEMSELAEYTDINAMIRFGITGTVGIRRAMLYYDLYFEILDHSVMHGCTSLLGSAEAVDGTYVFRLMSSDRLDGLSLSETLTEAILREGGILEIKNLEDSTGISLTFSEGGGVNA